ncbi:GFA family protein [Rhizobiaceae bacterium n13]|uniref:GFA family protein n=1 Tax=Ferirhizobium litorale TaxID=2927786 RepID=A0AAE3QFN2_9HYPH|nr:GFA family protein [Fererhizobium litorale]MDI7864527.1 GFA family protein [Fererhizobium litorale]MDI7924932.1 GFA family protein [Fererhizobium litorale]
MSEVFDGGCFCGRIRYRLNDRPMFVHCCHCRDCQRQTGSAFAINALIEADRVELVAGEPVVTTLSTDSGHPHDVYRCSECQSALWSDYGRRRWMSFVRVASLDDPSAFAPDVHIYARSKLPWVRLPEGATVFEEYYDMKEQWPADSLARRRKAGAAAKASQ